MRSARVLAPDPPGPAARASQHLELPAGTVPQSFRPRKPPLAGLPRPGRGLSPLRPLTWPRAGNSCSSSSVSPRAPTSHSCTRSCDPAKSAAPVATRMR